MDASWEASLFPDARSLLFNFESFQFEPSGDGSSGDVLSSESSERIFCLILENADPEPLVSDPEVRASSSSETRSLLRRLANLKPASGDVFGGSSGGSSG